MVKKSTKNKIDEEFDKLESKVDKLSSGFVGTLNDVVIDYDEPVKPTIIDKVRKLLEDEGFVLSSESDYGIQRYMTLWRKNEWFKLDNKTEVKPPEKLRKKYGW